MTEYPDRIPQHRHCTECGKAFAGDGHFCGDACREAAGAVAKKKIRKLMLIWLAIVAATIAAIAIYSMAGA